MVGNILVVEDDDRIRTLLMDVLRERAERVDGARDGADALHQIAIRAYAVVILDLVMPYMSGIDFLDSLQALASDPSLRTPTTTPAVVVITGMADDAMPSCELERRFPSLVRAVLRKPIDPDTLRSLIDGLVRGA